MTVTTTSVLSGPYYPNGAAKSFPFGFKVFDRTDLRVFNRTDAADIDYDQTLYTVQAGDASGSVNFTVPPAAGATLYIALDPPFTNGISFGIEESFLPQVHNEGFDRSALRDQYLKDAFSRSIQSRPGESMTPLPRTSVRAGKLLEFDDAGNPQTLIEADAVRVLIADHPGDQANIADLKLRAVQAQPGEPGPLLTPLSRRIDRLPWFRDAGTIDVVPGLADTALLMLSPSGAPRPVLLTDLIAARSPDLEGGNAGVSGDGTGDLDGEIA